VALSVVLIATTQILLHGAGAHGRAAPRFSPVQPHRGPWSGAGRHWFRSLFCFPCAFAPQEIPLLFTLGMHMAVVVVPGVGMGVHREGVGVFVDM
jgi:hypothetical protein